MIKAIVFDKDGTLTDFNKTWLPAVHVVAEIFSGDNVDLKEQLMIAGGWDPVENRITSGSVIAAGDLNDLLDCYLEIIPELENRRAELSKEAEQIYNRMSVDAAVQSTDLKALFSELRSRNIKIGVATMDSESAAHSLFEKLDLAGDISYVAGYDSGHGVKPASGMIDGFIKKTGIAAEHIMVVGDNTHDTDMGRNANVSLVIGVLTGNSLHEDLDGHADYILEDVSKIPALLDQLQQS